ncbi:monoheme cytochrome c, putative [Robiginitalea biformata HTCC2501]|uniref:Monoheme cytochrome c, putative n=2 Tax=Flavobacteriaceae TaxID=49546 RepID=A4CIC2_ROBBH|nr:monoheme cytochrome c, putative [Robiginitalea biformata HTCC2501]
MMETSRGNRKRGHLPGILLGGAILLALGAALWFRDTAGAGSPAETGPETADTAGIAAGGVRDGIHLATGFREGDGLPLVITHCTPCHSAELVTQNRMTREGWESTIRWMQETQNLWDLGENEAAILDYLATYYAPEEQGRRPNLEDIEWYELESD